MKILLFLLGILVSSIFSQIDDTFCNLDNISNILKLNLKKNEILYC